MGCPHGVERIRDCQRCWAQLLQHCPECGSAPLHIEDTVMGETMVSSFSVRGEDSTYRRLRPVRAVFCCACEWASEWSVFEKGQ